MPPSDRDPAFGIIVGAVLGTISTVALFAAVAAWGDVAVRYLVWVALVIREMAA